MKSFFLTLFFILLLQNANSQVNNDSSTIAKGTAFDIEKIAIGDINNDQIIDTAFVKTPKYSNDEDWGDCRNGGCEVSIKFSCSFPNIEFGNAVSAGIENIGDIDKDGICELIITPGWIIGCWGQVHFYTLKNKEWTEIGRVKRNICREEKSSHCIKKIKNKKIIAIEEVWVDGDLVEKTKTISVN